MKKNTESNATNLPAVILAALVLIASLGLVVTTALSAGLLVTTADDESDGCAVGNCSLREAIAAASPGDIITFAGDYDIVLTSTLTLDKSLTIDGSGHAITIDGNDAVRVFHVSADTHVTFNHLTIAHGRATTPEWPELSPMYPVGGGIKIESGAVVTLTNSVVDSNIATYSDGGLYGHGGGVFNLGTLTVSGTTFSDNVASSSTERGYGSGGAIHNRGTLFVSGSTFTGNGAITGGAIYSDSGTTMVVENSTFTGNSAPCGGGGISGSGTTTVSGCTISNNLCPGGWCGGGAAGIQNRSGIMTVSNSTISGNNGYNNAGGLSNYEGELTVTESAIYNNATGGPGGGIYNWYNVTLTLRNCTIHGNAASWGGGIYSGAISDYGSTAQLIMINNTISGNTATDDGGGLYNHEATATVTNSILWGNTASRGPQIYNFNTTGPTISHSDIQNSGGSGAGWDTTLGADGGGNLDQVPLLGPLADNGGPTLTQALPDGSPAIDMADAATCPGTDQRGVPRPLGSGCDIGAFENGAGEVLFHTVTYDANGATSGTDPADQTKIYNVILTLAINSGGLARTGHTFTGWNTEADGSGTHYPEAATYTTDAALALYADWMPVPYTVTYDANGATSGTVPVDGNTYKMTDQVTVLGNTGSLVKTGYTFADWNTVADGSGSTFNDGDNFFMGDLNVTLYAQWADAGPSAIPALSEWGMILFSLLMAAAAVIFMRRRNKVAA